jgi:hypothetical protein
MFGFLSTISCGIMKPKAPCDAYHSGNPRNKSKYRR